MTSRKLMLLGEIGVGKTSLINRFIHGRFGTDYLPTINVEIYTHDLPATDTRPPLTLLIWDTDGNFGETIFSSVYMKNAAAALIVADARRPATLSALAGLAQGWRTARPGRPFSLVVNKTDLLGDQEPPPPLPDEISESTRSELRYTSALTGDNVEATFHAAVDAIVRRGL